MSLIEFKNVLKIVLGAEPTEEEKKELFKEVALMVLARATSADTNMKKIEVKYVQDALKRLTGEFFAIPDVKIAAQSEIFERSPLEKYLSKVGRKLDTESRVEILKCLADVVRADGRVSHFETDYFDMVAGALKATPSELVGLIAVEVRRSA
jgi:uncharacterized tellurite resistance protein B-like protein